MKEGKSSELEMKEKLQLVEWASRYAALWASAFPGHQEARAVIASGQHEAGS